jgi:predicted metal-dependent peptidase
MDGSECPIPMTDEEKESLEREWKEAATNAARTAGAGNVPAGVKRMIDEMTAPKMDWRELLNTQLKSLLKNDYTFMKPSRKTWGMGDVILPGMDTEETVDVAICIDTSGSISNDMLRDFLSEVQGIMEEFETFHIKLWFFDTETYTVHEFNSDNISDLTDSDFEIEGGGGTEFACNWDLMKEMDYCPNQLVMFTDGYPWGSWGDPDYCDTLFVIHGSKDIEAPFGISVYYEYS